MRDAWCVINKCLTHHALEQIIPSPIAMKGYLRKDAVFSPCRSYRYALWRIWDEQRPYPLFICLNPSTADEVTDDPTLVRCINYAQAWGYGGVCTANLFAYRATKPADLLSTQDPIGIENDAWLCELARDAKLVVAAWGNLGTHLGRSQEVMNLVSGLHCLKINKTGEPAHPLYLRADLRPFPYKPPVTLSN